MGNYLYSSLSTHHTNTLSAFWNTIPPTNPTTLSQIQATAALAQVFVANGVGPTVTIPTVNTQGATPTIGINFSVPNIFTVTGTQAGYINNPTFTNAEILIYNASPSATPLLVYDSTPGSLANANSGGPLTEESTANNSASQYTFTLPATTTATLLNSPPARYWVLVKTFCTIAATRNSSAGLSGPYWSNLAQLSPGATTRIRRSLTAERNPAAVPV